MGHSQADKIATHQRILDIAAKRFREHGIDGISIADLMKEAGLTVGGFYKHFASREELVAAAFQHALEDIASWEGTITMSPRQAMRTYISEAHRDAVANGCPIAALANDVSRSTDETREIYTNRVRRIMEQISKALPTEDSASKRSEAALIVSACIGAITLSRAISDPKLSKQVLDGTLAKVLDLLTTKRNRKP
ncbi:TetR/AcrR family transcriptional regulator [Paraburkholderia silviterrae]|uniref:TetR/AcrR family transcriptional regulator n=1 Tax=Paraburkholderia silviterrae TaxID=2528715 RepID=A0A4R5M0Y8_9BURK|nr:TetR/AcrR family transcriptional regulator [Paraburkholderia silviterrae]TDG18867.1 TetR/AcrR family transcriptional regulator [Paraburkholderia silviterrae]